MNENETRPLDQRLFEALGGEPLSRDKIQELEDQGVITHAEARILWDSDGESIAVSENDE